MAADLLKLIPDGSSLAKEAESETTSRELVISTQFVQPSSTSEDSDPAPQAPKQVEGVGSLEHPLLAIKGSRLAPRTLKKKKGRRQKAVGAGAEDFIMWVPPISLRSPDKEEEEEEEDDMSGLVQNFAARKRKRDAMLEQAVDAVPKVAGGVTPHFPGVSLTTVKLWKPVCLML